MTETQFTKLIDSILSTYTTTQGSLAEITTDTKDILRLCVSTMRNKNRIVPDKCLLWFEEKLVYKGNLCSKKLMNRLNRYPIKTADVTCINNMVSGKKADFTIDFTVVEVPEEIVIESEEVKEAKKWFDIGKKNFRKRRHETTLYCDICPNNICLQ